MPENLKIPLTLSGQNEIEIDRFELCRQIQSQCTIAISDIIVHIKINTHINANSNLITNLYQNIIRYECVSWIRTYKTHDGYCRLPLLLVLLLSLSSQTPLQSHRHHHHHHFYLFNVQFLTIGSCIARTQHSISPSQLVCTEIVIDAIHFRGNAND